MADDDGNDDTGSDGGEEKITLAKVEEVVRKVLGEIAPGTKAPEVDPGTDDDEPAVYSVRQAEDLARRTVEEAMKVLDAKPKKTPAKKDDDDGTDDDDGASGSGGGSGKPKSKPKEPAPTPPKETGAAWQLRLRKLLVGAD